MSPDTNPETRLASYGSLAPGRVNHHQLSGLTGQWQRATVKGRLLDAGWGAAIGYPGLVLDPDGADVEVFVFESADLPEHWSRLDEFEGSAYQRVVTNVYTADGELNACIYVVNPAVNLAN